MSISSSSDALGTYPLSRPMHELPSMHQKIAFNKVDKVAKQIEVKYNISAEDFYKKICNKDAQQRLRSELSLNTCLFDGKKVYKAMAYGAGIGSAVGFLVGGTSGLILVIVSKGNIPLALKIFAAGAGSVGGIGAGIGVYCGLRVAKKEGRIKILCSDQFKEWKAGLDKEQYDLFLNCLKNYSNIQNSNLCEKHFCPLTLEIPTIPVISPNGHVYEKEAIEAHLDRAWAKIQRYRESGYSEAMPQFQEQMTTICPLRGKPFRKEDLKYALNFVTNVIHELKKLENQLKVDPNRDPILLQGIIELLSLYRSTYQSVTARVIQRLTEDLMDLGATREHRDMAIDSFRNYPECLKQRR